MNYQVALVLATLVVVAVDGLDQSQAEASCRDFTERIRIGKVEIAEPLEDCAVRCIFEQYYDQNGSSVPAQAPTGDPSSSSTKEGTCGNTPTEVFVAPDPDNSLDPAMSISQNGGESVKIEVHLAAGALEECETGKVCVSGKCTAVLPNYKEDCIANVGPGAMAVESSRKCFIKCVRVVTNYNTGGSGGVYQERQSRKELLVLNMPIPDRAHCGDGSFCNAGYCMDKETCP